MRRCVTRHRDERGVTFTIVALFSLAMFAFLALVIDLGMARQETRRDQNLSDAAALAAAQDLPDAATAKARATQYAVPNSADGTTATPVTCSGAVPANTTCYKIGSADVQVTTPYTMTGSAIAPKNLVRVRVCQPTATFFAKVIGATSPTVCRDAVARRIPGAKISMAGVLALEDGAGCVDYDMRGSNGSVLTVSGAVIANCENDPPNNFSGSNGQIRASTGFWSVGDCAPASECVGNGSTTSVNSLPGPVADPFASLPEPTATTPGFTNLTVSAYNKLSCLDGLYRVTGSTEMAEVIPTCPGKTSFTYLETAGLEPKTGIKSEITQIAPTTGTYAGIALFLGRSNPNGINWNGNSKGAAIYNGTVYAPNANIEWGGNIDVIINGQVIGRSFYLHGGGSEKNLGFVVNVPNTVPDIELVPDIGLEE